MEITTKELELLEDIKRAAINWWEGKRPIRWNKEKHLKNILVNLNGRNYDLAQAVANYIKQKG